MLHHLRFKLTVAFALVTAIGVIVTVVLTRQGAMTRFAHFMLDHHMIRPAQMQQVLADYYQENQSWARLDEALPLIVEAASDGVMRDMMGSMMGMHDNRMQVVDRAGQVVADTEGSAGITPLPAATVQQWSIVMENQEVGVLLVEGELMTATPARHATLVQGVTRAVLLAGLIAGVVGCLLALLLVRQITHPLATLTHASSRIAAGDLRVRVPVESQDELGDLAATFNRMANHLETHETLRRNLMADVAHELRTPLAGIQGTVEALQDGIFPLDQENLGAIHNQVMLLNRLVEDLRTLATAEAGQLTLERRPVDLRQVCEAEVAAFQPQALAQQVTLTLHTADMLPPVEGDRQRLGQVLNNLLSNALRYTPSGGRVQVALTAPNGHVQLAVSDSGAGIAPADLPHLFDRFYRGNRSAGALGAGQTGGSGLGLAIARQLVQAQQGRIWAESPPPEGGSGSVFYVELPTLAGNQYDRFTQNHTQRPDPRNHPGSPQSQRH